MQATVALAITLLSTVLSRASAGSNGQQYWGPDDQSPGAFSSWYSDYLSWVDETSSSLDLSNYELLYTIPFRTSFIQPQVMMHDRFLFDRSTNTYTADKFLDDLNSRYSGVDSLLICRPTPT